MVKRLEKTGKTDKLEGEIKTGKQERKNRSHQKNRSNQKVSHLYPRLYIARNHFIWYLKPLSSYKQAISISDHEGPASSILILFWNKYRDLCSQVFGFHMLLSALSHFAFCSPFQFLKITWEDCSILFSC